MLRHVKKISLAKKCHFYLLCFCFFIWFWITENVWLGNVLKLWMICFIIFFFVIWPSTFFCIFFYKYCFALLKSFGESVLFFLFFILSAIYYLVCFWYFFEVGLWTFYIFKTNFGIYSKSWGFICLIIFIVIHAVFDWSRSQHSCRLDLLDWGFQRSHFSLRQPVPHTVRAIEKDLKKN